MYVLPRLVAGIFSFLLIGLVIVGPIYAVEKIQKFETSRSGGAISLESITSESNTTYSLVPYIDHNEETAMYVGPYYYELFNGNWYFDSSDGIKFEADYTYSFDGTADTTSFDLTVDPAYDLRWFIIIQVDPEDLLEDDVDYLHLEVGSTAYWDINYLGWIGRDEDKTYTITDPINVPTGMSGQQTGNRANNLELTTTILNDAISSLSSYASEDRGFLIRVYFEEGYTTGTTVNTNFYFGPDYYEVYETTWDNQTVLTPYNQPITTFLGYKVTMVIGGILIFVVGWIASPWSEQFDKLLPINNFGVLGSQRSKHYNKKGRSK